MILNILEELAADNSKLAKIAILKREYNNECAEDGEEDGNNPLLQFKLLFGL